MNSITQFCKTAYTATADAVKNVSQKISEGKKNISESQEKTLATALVVVGVAVASPTFAMIAGASFLASITIAIGLTAVTSAAIAYAASDKDNKYINVSSDFIFKIVKDVCDKIQNLMNRCVPHPTV